MEVHNLCIQAENEVLRSDDGLEHAKILVGRLALDRCLLETAEGMDDTLLALARRRVNPGSGEKLLAPRSQTVICRLLQYVFNVSNRLARIGSVYQSNLLKRKGLCFSCLRLGLIRHRRSLRSSHLFTSV